MTVVVLLLVTELGPTAGTSPLQPIGMKRCISSLSLCLKNKDRWLMENDYGLWGIYRDSIPYIDYHTEYCCIKN